MKYRPCEEGIRPAAVADDIVVATFRKGTRIGVQPKVALYKGELQDRTLWRVRFLVENVLKGGLHPGQTIDVALFDNYGNGDLSKPSRDGVRFILLLRQEPGNVFRVVADNCAVPLTASSNSRMDIFVDPGRPIEDVLMDLIAVRGANFDSWSAVYQAELLGKP